MWDAVVELSWRAYPAAVLMALGLAWGLPGARRFVVGIRPPYGSASQTLDALQGFRRGIIGLAIAALGAAWLWQIDALFVLALVIGAEEAWESTLHIQAVSMSKRRQERRAAAITKPLQSPTARGTS